MFTAEGGHGTELFGNAPPAALEQLKAQLLRIPKTADEARQQVRDLKGRNVSCIKAILEAGWGQGMLFNRLDVALLEAVGAEARAQSLPLVVHTGDARDVADAVEAGAASIEHGSWRGPIPDALLQKMASRGVYLDPTLGVAEAYAQLFSGKADALATSLVQQSVTASVLKGTRELLSSGKSVNPALAAVFAGAVAQGSADLVRAWKAGVPLAMGTDAGNPLVFHGSSMHHEMQLWVRAGIPPAVVLQAATSGGAKLLGAADRFGAIRTGMEANLLMVDGNPLEDISATERISLVLFKGERIRRPALFDQK